MLITGASRDIQVREEIALQYARAAANLTLVSVGHYFVWHIRVLSDVYS